MKECVIIYMCLLLMACNESFPGLYAPVEEEDNPHPEVTEDRIPIKLSATDPSFSIVTRGLGAFGDWSNVENRERWRKADFYVYAFLARNHEYVGNVNYGGEEVNFMLNNDDGRLPYCLVKNRLARFTGSDEPTLEWVGVPEEGGGQPYYCISYPDYQFNFFMYHIDNAQLFDTQASNDCVIYDIGVDGTQDVISGYAHATESDTENVDDGEESLYLWSHWSQLIYSARSGHRQIHPRFFIQHQMARLRFGVRGISKEFSNKIQVMAVSVKSRWRGEFTVARDWHGGWSWEETASEPLLGVEWKEDKRNLFLATSTTPGDYGSTFEMDKCLFNPMVTVDYNESRDLGEIMLPPDKSYTIYIMYKMKDRPNEVFTATYSNVGFAEEKKQFEAGKSYEVLLRIYGPQSIMLQVDGAGLTWTNGGSIDVDKGEDI